MNLLSVADLRIEFESASGPLTAVEDVSFDINAGEVVGLVGESGSGKSLTTRAIMRLVAPGSHINAGSVSFDGRDVLSMRTRELRAYRAREVGMVFQDSSSSLNPVLRVGTQLCETLRLNAGMDGRTARATAVEMLDRVGISKPQQRLKSYPHELSGGMRQRVMIALATAAKPRLLLADEPTTALDVLTQKQILLLLDDMRRDLGMAMLLVSHDFGVIAQMCDRALVMYAGRIVESGPVAQVYNRPAHPYTRALLASVPELDAAGRPPRRELLGGQPPALGDQHPGCVFATRCSFARPACQDVSMQLLQVDGVHLSACPFEQPPHTQPELSSQEARP